MLEGRITKVGIGTNNKGNTVVLGVAEYEDRMVNISSVYDWETIDLEGFLKDLREQLAKDLDIGLSKMDIRSRFLIEKMAEGHEWSKTANSLIYQGF